MNAVCWLAGFLLGWLVDDRTHTTPLFVILGLVAGIALGGAASYREVRKYLQQ